MTDQAEPGQLVIRPFEPDDVGQVATIEQTVARDPWSKELFASEFDVPAASRLWLVAVTDDCIVGYGGLMFAADDAHVMNVGVAPSAQRRGIARRLLAELLQQAVDGGSVNATLEVRSSNAPALALYERFGFSDAGTRPGYYQDGEDARIMWAYRIYRPDYGRLLATLATESEPGARPS